MVKKLDISEELVHAAYVYYLEVGKYKKVLKKYPEFRSAWNVSNYFNKYIYGTHVDSKSLKVDSKIDRQAIRRKQLEAWAKVHPRGNPIQYYGGGDIIKE